MQRGKAFVLGTNGRHVHRKQTVYSFAVTNDGRSLLQNIYHVFDTGSATSFNNTLNPAISTFFLNDFECAVANSLRHKVHALVIHAQVVHHLGANQRLHQFLQTFKPSKTVNQHCFKRQARTFSANFFSKCFLLGHKLVGCTASSGKVCVGVGSSGAVHNFSRTNSYRLDVGALAFHHVLACVGYQFLDFVV